MVKAKDLTKFNMDKFLQQKMKEERQEQIYEMVKLRSKVRKVNRALSALKKTGLYDDSVAVDNIFNSYIFPAIMLDDFGEITKGMNDTQLSEIFMDTCKNPRLAKEVALALQDPTIRRQFINSFCDLNYLYVLEQSFLFV